MMTMTNFEIKCQPWTIDTNKMAVNYFVDHIKRLQANSAIK